MAYQCFPFGPNYTGDMRRYPGHAEIHGYLKAFAEEKKVEVKFDSPVENIEKVEGKWEVRYRGGNDKFDAIVIANGHYETKHVPDFTGHFDGKILHSHDYKSPKDFAGKRVIFLGSA